MSIHHTSTDTAYDSFIIFALDRPEDADEFLAAAEAANIGVKELNGSYKGVEETSYIINHKYYAFILNYMFKQESVLVLSPLHNFGGGDQRRPATLIYNPLSGRESVDLGYFTEVGEERARQEEAWTYDPASDKWWITLPA